jgi:hypothetical protein
MYEETNLIKEDLSLSNPYQVDLSVAMYHERSPLPDTRYTDQFPSYQTTEGVTGHSSATHRISPNDRVRLSRIDQVKYFYKDEIIGFQNGPPPRSRQSSPILS